MIEREKETNRMSSIYIYIFVWYSQLNDRKDKKNTN
jgi:hypothetical protein